MDKKKNRADPLAAGRQKVSFCFFFGSTCVLSMNVSEDSTVLLLENYYIIRNFLFCCLSS